MPGFSGCFIFRCDPFVEITIHPSFIRSLNNSEHFINDCAKVNNNLLLFNSTFRYFLSYITFSPLFCGAFMPYRSTLWNFVAFPAKRDFLTTFVKLLVSPSPFLPLSSSFCLLPTPYFLLPTPYSLLPTPYCLSPIAYRLSPNSSCQYREIFVEPQQFNCFCTQFCADKFFHFVIHQFTHAL
jgi:hypothetical protein